VSPLDQDVPPPPPLPSAASAAPQPEPLAAVDEGWFKAEAFDLMKKQMLDRHETVPAWLDYEEYGPIWYFKYFMAEAVHSPEKAKLVDPFNRLFYKQRGLGMRLKPGLVPVKYKEDYIFAQGRAGAETWRTALTEMMLLGFKGVKVNDLDQVSDSLQNAMLERDYFRRIALDSGGNGEVEYFWRGDGRPKESFLNSQTATCAVDTDDSAKRFRLNSLWSPYSDPEIKGKMWLRVSANVDNDYFTLVSVGLDFRAVVAFPLLDEAKAYGWAGPGGLSDPTTIVPPESWDQPKLNTYSDYLALVHLRKGGDKIRLATRNYVYMMAFTNGAVIDTSKLSVAKGERLFPERGVRGIPRSEFVGCIPVLRIHHGAGRQDGFTCFRQPLDSAEILNDDVLKHRWGKIRADSMKSMFYEAAKYRDTHLRTAWAYSGYQDPVSQDVVESILRYPVGQVSAGDSRLS
jgi:hypothetical protein